jgi:hypothetical protein
MNSLVKVPPYSKLNFQGKTFFTQNWCNITLNQGLLLKNRLILPITISTRSDTGSNNRLDLIPSLMPTHYACFDLI